MYVCLYQYNACMNILVDGFPKSISPSYKCVCLPQSLKIAPARPAPAPPPAKTKVRGRVYSVKNEVRILIQISFALP